MKSNYFSKSRLIAILCCLCLGLTAMVSAIFLFGKQEQVFAEEEVSGFYVEDGASVRFDDVRTGLRFKTVVTEEQYNAWKETYGNDATYDFHTVISFATPGEEATDVDCVADIASHDFTKGDFVYYAAIFFDLKDGSTDLPIDELIAIYSAEYKAESYVLIDGTKVDAESDDTLRSIRSVALSNVLKETVADQDKNDILKGFIVNNVGGEKVSPDFMVSGEAYYYDNYRDATAGLVINLPDELPAGIEVNGLVGATAIPESDFIVSGDTVTVKNVAKYLSVGEAEFFTLDIPALNGVMALSNVIDATEVFYNEKDGVTGVERLNANFAIKASGANDTERATNYFADANKVVETAIDEEGNVVELGFYNVNRGYYVLAEDITFPTLSGNQWVPSKNADIEKGAMNHDVLTYSSGNSGAKLYSGLFGFGGTFDGLGHTIYGLKTSYVSNAYYTSGLFGALAYGATIKNVAFEDATKRPDENHTHASILATYAGSSATVNGFAEDGTATKNAYNYLVAKYGSADCITIDNCFFGMDKSVVNDTDQSVFEVPKKADASTYAQGTFAVMHEGDAQFVTFSNCVLDTFNHRAVYGHQENGGVGWIGRTGGYNWLNDNDGIFENCYMISSQRADGEIPTVFEHRSMTINYDDETSGIRGNWIIEDIEGTTYYGYKSAGEWVKKGTSWTNLPGNSMEFYAANDFVGIDDGTPVYSGLNDDAWVVSADADAYTPNVTLYHYTNLYRFDNYIDMSANNSASIANFNDSWVKVGNAVVWKGLADVDNEGNVITDLSVQLTNLTNPGSTALEVGDELSVAVSYGGKDVTAAATLVSSNDGVFIVEDGVINCIATGEATLYVTAGGFTAEVDMLVTANNASEVVLSSAYSAIYGATEQYSVPYVKSGSNLVKTSYLELYQQTFADNGATITAVYELVDGAKTALNLVTVDGVAYTYVSNPGNQRKTYTIIIEGSKGLVTLGNLSVVTGVIADAEGFNYIPSTAESRSGYYVLANDFDNNGRAAGWQTRTNSILGVTVGSDQMGYSFGGFDEEKYAKLAQNTTTLATAKSYIANFYNAFVGTFDGLGHTIDNMFVDPVGLLGAFTNEAQPSVLKNVKFSNLRAGLYAHGTPYGEDVTPTKVMKKQALIASLVYPGATAMRGTLAAESQIKLDNVVIEIATSGHRTDVANYLGSGDRNWTMFRGERYIIYNEDGTYKDKGNFATQQRSINKLALSNVAFKVPTGELIGENNSSNYGGTIISYQDEGANYAAYHNQVFAFKDMSNVYIISAPAANGKIAYVTQEHTSASALSNVGMAQNDFYSIFTEKYDEGGNTGLYYYESSYQGGPTYVSTTRDCYTAPKEVKSGYGYLTTTNGSESTTELVYVQNVDTFAEGLESNQTFVAGNNGLSACTYTIYYPTPFYRYDTYAAAASASVTKIGNFTVSASGIIWTEA